MTQENKNKLTDNLENWLREISVNEEFAGLGIDAQFLTSVIEGAIQGISMQKTRNDQMFSNQGVNENLFENKRVIEG